MQVTTAERISSGCRYITEVRRMCNELYSPYGKSIEMNGEEGSITYIFKDESKIRLIEENYKTFY